MFLTKHIHELRVDLLLQNSLLNCRYLIIKDVFSHLSLSFPLRNSVSSAVRCDYFDPILVFLSSHVYHPQHFNLALSIQSES